MFFVPFEIPLGINPIKNYLLIFYAGYILQINNFSKCLFRKEALIYSSILFIIFFLLKINIGELIVFENVVFFERFIHHTSEVALKALCALFGIVVLFNLSNKYVVSNRSVNYT